MSFSGWTHQVPDKCGFGAWANECQLNTLDFAELLFTSLCQVQMP